MYFFQDILISEVIPMQNERLQLETSVNNLTDERWQAIVHNDSSYDNKFLYAVKTTGIFLPTIMQI